MITNQNLKENLNMKTVTMGNDGAIYIVWVEDNIVKYEKYNIVGTPIYDEKRIETL